MKVWVLLIAPLIPINNFLIAKYSKYRIKHQPIFIIGSPRTGSSILYQALTNQADVLYFDNLACRFNRVLFIGFWLSNKIFGGKSHNCFQSNHGNTSAYGNHAPGECGGFWYRWLPTHRHFIDFGDLEGLDCVQIKKEITAISNYFDRPIVFKNLNAGQRMRLIQKIFPDAKFIFIRREPLYTAQSILKAKRSLGIQDNQFWSIMPPNVKELEGLEWQHQIVQQIYYLEKQILQDSKLFPQQNLIELSYLDLNQHAIDKLIKKFGLQQRAAFDKAMFNISEEITITNSDKSKLTEAIEKLDWLGLYD